MPEETVADRFAVLFAGLERAHGTTNVPRLKLNKAKGKMEGSSFIVKEAPAVGHWERHLAGSYGLGIFPLRDDGTCSWGAIDIDVYDLDHKALEQQVRTLGLPLVITRTKVGRRTPFPVYDSGHPGQAGPGAPYGLGDCPRLFRR